MFTNDQTTNFEAGIPTCATNHDNPFIEAKHTWNLYCSNPEERCVTMRAIFTSVRLSLTESLTMEEIADLQWLLILGTSLCDIMYNEPPARAV